MRDASRALCSMHGACVLGGTLVLVAALSPPFHAWAEARLSVHMVQHLLLIVVAAPLLALGSPARAALQRLPARARPALSRGARLLRPLRQLPGTIVASGAWVAHVGVVWTWHAPPIYSAAVRTPWLHAVEHVSLLGSAWAFWIIALRPSGRRALGIPGTLVYLFAAAAQGTVLGALMTLAPVPWYDVHEAATRSRELSPLDDQQLAGLIMWIPGALVYLLAALAMLGHWLRAVEGRDRRDGVVGLGLVVAAFVAGGCGDAETPASGNRLPRRAVVGGDPARGEAAVERHGCGGCHVIPGVRSARGIVGPSLAGLVARPYLAGGVVNEPGNLIAWIRDPRALLPATAMPRLGVTEAEARDMAAFLYGLPSK